MTGGRTARWSNHDLVGSDADDAERAASRLIEFVRTIFRGSGYAGMRSESHSPCLCDNCPSVALVLFSRRVLDQRWPKTYLDAGNAYFRPPCPRASSDAQLPFASRRDLRGHLRLAQTYERTSDLQNAYREYIRAADLLPDRAEVQVKAGNFLLAAGRFEDAKARAEQVLQGDPKNVDGQVLLGYSLAGMKNLDGAIEQLEQAVAAAPNKGMAFSNLGTLQLARGDVKRAEAAFRKAVDINADVPMPLIALANFLWAQGRFKEAEECLVKARQLEPGDVVAARALAILYTSTNRVAEAEPILKAAAEKSTTPSAGLMLADYYAASHRPDDALTALGRLSSHKAAEVEVKGRTAMILHAQGRAQMRTIVDDLLKQHADGAPARLIKAQFLFRDRRFDEALTEADARLKFDSRSALGYRCSARRTRRATS